MSVSALPLNARSGAAESSVDMGPSSGNPWQLGWRRVCGFLARALGRDQDVGTSSVLLAKAVALREAPRVIRPMAPTAVTRCPSPRVAPAGRGSAVTRPLRVVRTVAPGAPRESSHPRILISGNMSDVCAELERLAALEAVADEARHREQRA